MNSREKGKVGEREFASLLREHGFDARRGQQFSGGAESPDVVSPALPWLHIEVKRTQALNLADACAQAEGDCSGKPWVVAHRRNHAPWLITMRAEVFFQLVKGDSDTSPHPMTRSLPLARPDGPSTTRIPSATSQAVEVPGRGGEGKPPMNSREKGKRGERLWRDQLRAAGFTARRGQQFAGGVESPDVVCAELDWIHFEVKCVERLNIEEAMEQARTDCGSQKAEGGVQKVPVVAHKRCRRPWLVTMEAEVFFQLVKGFQPRIHTDETRIRDSASQAEGAHGVTRPTMGIYTEAWAPTQQRPTDMEISAAASAAANSSNHKPNTDPNYEDPKQQLQL